MPVQVKTARVDYREIQGVIAGLRVVATPEFAEEALGVRELGEKVLDHLKEIFPRSTIAPRGREPLVEGWSLFPHPPKGFSRNPGFTVRRRNSSLRDHEIIAALDQGSRAYERIIPRGQKVAFLNNGGNGAYPASEIGKLTFVTGNGKLFKYQAREGLHFMERTYRFAIGEIEKAETVFRMKVRSKILGNA